MAHRGLWDITNERMLEERYPERRLNVKILSIARSEFFQLLAEGGYGRQGCGTGGNEKEDEEVKNGTREFE